MGTKNYKPFLFFDVFEIFSQNLVKSTIFKNFGQNPNFLLNTCIILLPQLCWTIIYQFLKNLTKLLVFQIFDLKIAKKFDEFIEFFWKLVFQVPTPQTRLAIIKLLLKYEVKVFQLKPIFCQLSSFFCLFWRYIINFCRIPVFFIWNVSILQLFWRFALEIFNTFTFGFPQASLNVLRSSVSLQTLVTKTTLLSLCGVRKSAVKWFWFVITVGGPNVVPRTRIE